MTRRCKRVQREFYGKCEVEIDRERVIDFTLKNGKRVCELCFVREDNC
jgi:deoxycytidine triphosphate deaminase